MKLLIFTNHFFPENFKVNDIAFTMASKGHDVTVLTAIPDYPEGHFPEGYGFFKKRRETINGVKVIRMPLIARGKGGGIRLILNYLSLLFSSLFYALWLAFTQKYDKVFVHHTSPIMIGVPAIIVKRIQKIPLYFWNLDLWPESLTAAGGINNKTILKWVNKLVIFTYNNSDKILMSSMGFKTSILEKGDFADKLIYFPNWAESIFEAQKDDYEIPTLPEGFKIMYAGNVGEAQNLEKLMEVALKLKNELEIKWIIVGDGRKLNWVKNFVSEHQLQETVFFLGRFPFESMSSFYKEADAMLLSLKDTEIFRVTVPARLQSYIACSKPVLGMINGEAANIIHESNCGYTSNANDVDEFVNQILKMSQLSSEELKTLGANARLYYDKHFLRAHKLSELEELLISDE